MSRLQGMKHFADVDDYIRRHPAKVQTLLRRMRATIRKAAPRSTQRISYKVPAFCVDGKILVWYGAFASHIGLYPGAAAIAAFKKELSLYKNAKGSVQFPFAEPLPLDLVTRIVKFKLAREKSS
jgi:uncharacterized protein YdhG (YjbR/CyaY superfamily)